MTSMLGRVATMVVLGFVALAGNAQTFTSRPSTSSGTYSNPSYAYDGNQLTASTASVGLIGKGGLGKKETWSGFSSAPSGAYNMHLNISSAAQTISGCNDYGNECVVQLSYSLDGKTSTTVYFVENASRSEQTDVITLSPGQDLTKIQVTAMVSVAGTDPQSTTRSDQQVYEIWVSGQD